MKKLLIPLILLFVGVGGGVGAGLFLFPPEPAEDSMPEMALANPCGPDPTLASHGNEDDHASDEPATSEKDYARLSNQFVVPIVSGNELNSLVVMSLSVEVPLGQEDIVFLREPKLRDALLQVMFEHANLGGFDGNYTAPATMRSLRDSLRAAAVETIGPDASDVLILELVRQDV